MEGHKFIGVVVIRACLAGWNRVGSLLGISSDLFIVQ